MGEPTFFSKREGGRARAARLLLAAAFCFTLAPLSARAQEPSTDRRNPTPFTAASVEGDGDGDTATHYWRFTAGRGEVKLTAHAKTKAYSTLVDVELLDEAGRSLEKFSVVANEAGRTASVARSFVRRQPVIVRVFLREDRDVKHVKYELELSGAVEVGGASGGTAGGNSAGGTAVGASAGAQTAAGERLCLPAAGTLVLRLASGEDYEIDLTQVTKATIKN